MKQRKIVIRMYVTMYITINVPPTKKKNIINACGDLHFLYSFSLSLSFTHRKRHREKEEEEEEEIEKEKEKERARAMLSFTDIYNLVSFPCTYIY